MGFIRNEMAAIRRLTVMRRVVSTEREQAIREYYNRTADKLGIQRPLSAAGWHDVKRELRRMPADAVQTQLTEGEQRLHREACSDLAIDPEPDHASVVLHVMSWWFTPSDRHGVLSQLLRQVVCCAVAVALSAIMCGIAGLVLPVHPIGGTVVIAFLILVLMGLFMDNNLVVGAIGTLLVVVCTLPLMNAELTFLLSLVVCGIALHLLLFCGMALPAMLRALWSIDVRTIQRNAKPVSFVLWLTIVMFAPFVVPSLWYLHALAVAALGMSLSAMSATL